jgi:ATP-binding cassette subfamily C protein CydCD
MERSVYAVARVVQDTGPRRGTRTPPDLPARMTFDDVSFRYDGTETDALSAVTFDLPARGIVAIAGANGSGKSTCLRLLLALARPQRGGVRVGGVNVADVDLDSWCSRIAFLPQRSYLPQRSSVRSAIGLLIPDAPDARILAALTRVDLLQGLLRIGPDALAVPADALSVGQRQRLTLARLLCRNASLFLLDEPDANLDRAGIALVAGIVRELAESHAVVMAVHTPELLELADRVIVLDAGRVAKDEKRHPARNARGAAV